MTRTILIYAGVFGFLGVALGAFGAHGLEQIANEKEIANYNTGVRYHMMHTLALFGLATLASHFSSRSLRVIVVSFLLGILLFSGSLYLYALTHQSWFGAITPIGGVAFLVGWVALIVGAIQSPKDMASSSAG